MIENMPESLITSKGISIAKRTLTDCFSEHTHDFCELEYIISGKGHLILNGKKYPFSDKALFFFTPLDIEGIEVEEEVTLLNIGFNNEWIDSSVENDLTMPAVLENYSFPYVERLCREYSKEDGYTSTVIESILSVMLIDIARKNREVEFEHGKRYPENIRSAIRYIHVHFKENLTLTGIAEHVYLNPSYLSYLFREHTHKSISQYICDMRLTYAQRLLNRTNDSIADICYSSGFSSYSNFSRFFKARYGTTPKKMRADLTTKPEDI